MAGFFARHYDRLHNRLLRPICAVLVALGRLRVRVTHKLSTRRLTEAALGQPRSKRVTQI